MYFLYDSTTCHLLAIIGDGDVRRLINDPAVAEPDCLGYTYTATELDDLAARGADDGLVRLLRDHLGARPQAAVHWGARQEERIMTPEEVEAMLPAGDPEPLH